jgi:hypothetical protein
VRFSGLAGTIGLVVVTSDMNLPLISDQFLSARMATATAAARVLTCNFCKM